MTALKCPHCGYRSHFTHHYHWSGAQGEYGSSLFTCDECGKPIAAMTDLEGEPIEYWPTKVWGKDFPDVPSQIASTASEAHICLGAGSPRGAVTLARAVVESQISADGVYVIGSDIPGGTWHSSGGQQCYEATLASTDTSNIIDNNNFTGPDTVDLSGAKAFDITGGCTWQQISS